MKTFVSLFIFLVFFLSLSFNFAQADEQIFTPQKARYQVIDLGKKIATDNKAAKDPNYEITLWADSRLLGLRFAKDNQMLLWQNWQSSSPTVYQLFLNEKYRIEYETLDSVGFEKLLNQSRQLIATKNSKDKAFKSSAAFNGKTLRLIASSSAAKVAHELQAWEQFKTFDYADIGDNEADPVLGKLIRQGFRPSF